ncbi:MAG: prephenate dehydrogenase [Candidatus Zixiibacteriota bacterium]|nr:MAG: prephenate dehydrogenase [candidate division Zixibacteria bacterium]
MLRSGKYKVFIIGLGQIGGSLGYDLVTGSFATDVIGYDNVISVCNYARRNKAVNRTVRTVAKGIRQADIIFLSTPIRETGKILPSVCKIAGKGQIILDVTGVKTGVFKTLKTLDFPANYLSCHPVAGTERTGIEGARKGLFKAARFIIIPLRDKDVAAVRPVAFLAKSIGSWPIIMKPGEHDRLIALTSNLPHALALCLTKLANEQARLNPNIRHMIGGSFKSASRVAFSSSELILDMFLTNSENVSSAIERFLSELKSMQQFIKGRNEKKLIELIELAKATEGVGHNE